MLGLAHSAELSADEIKKANAELRATNERLEEEISALRSVVAQAERGSSTARSHVTAQQAAPKKSAKGKGSYSKIRSVPKDSHVDAPVDAPVDSPVDAPIGGAASGS